MAALLDDTSLFQRHVCTILVDGLQCAAGNLETNEFIELGNPDTLVLKVRGKFTFNDLGYVTANAALLLGQA